ncbi:BamA/TamA family outer membrane protein [Bacteroidota bacterium]
MNKLLALAILAFFLIPNTVIAQDVEEEEKEGKTGFVPVPIPAVAYDTDIGFLYGIVLQLTHYGDGTRYPLYDHYWYVEWSRTTKGSGKNMIRYDSDRLIPGIRTNFGLSYMTEQALDFYGFNGYRTYYNGNFTDDTHSDYKSRLFYKMDRKMFQFRTDFSGELVGSKLKWFAGQEFRNMEMDTVDIDRLNKGRSPPQWLPPVNGGLFGEYAHNWGIIDPNQIYGGSNTILKIGLIYDTRDNEPNPMQGMWTEAQFLYSPAALGNTEYSYTKLVLTHRQYFTILPEDLNFAYRLSYQTKLGGDIPYYMLPFYFNSPPSYTRDGMGGAKTLRGILRNRVVGNGYLLGNIELRWKFYHFQLLNQNIYLALSGFLDGGMVTNEYDINTSGVPPNNIFFPDDPEKMHFGTGAGFHLAINQNTIVAVDYGRVLDKRDGLSGLYIGFDWLF